MKSHHSIAIHVEMQAVEQRIGRHTTYAAQFPTGSNKVHKSSITLRPHLWRLAMILLLIAVGGVSAAFNAAKQPIMAEQGMRNSASPNLPAPTYAFVINSAEQKVQATFASAVQQPAADLCLAEAASRVNWSGCHMRHRDLRGALLRGAVLRNADLQGADLRGAILYRANLAGANLQGADLRGAMLDEANLRAAQLDGADWAGATLVGTDF